MDKTHNSSGQMKKYHVTIIFRVTFVKSQELNINP